MIKKHSNNRNLCINILPRILSQDRSAQIFNFHFFDRLECVSNFFAYVRHFVFLRDVWIRTQRAAIASRARYQLSHLYRTEIALRGSSRVPEKLLIRLIFETRRFTT